MFQSKVFGYPYLGVKSRHQFIALLQKAVQMPPRPVLNAGISYNTEISLACCCGRDFDLSRIFSTPPEEEFALAALIATNECGLRFLLPLIHQNDSNSLSQKTGATAIVIITPLTIEEINEIGKALSVELVANCKCIGARILSDPEGSAKKELHGDFTGIGAIIENGIVKAILNSESGAEIFKFLQTHKRS